MILNYLIISFVLNIIDTKVYGVWLTISSIISWVSFMDLGLGNGLKTKFVKLFLFRKYSLIRIYISSSIFTMSIIGAIVLLIASGVSASADLGEVLQTTIPHKTLFWIVFLSVFFFIAKAITDLIQTYKVAEQGVSYTTYISFVSNMSLFIIVFLLSVMNKKVGLLPVSFIFSFPPFLLSAIYAIILLKTKYSNLRPGFKYVNFKLTRDVYKLSLAFFLIQFSSIIIFSTDNVIISSLFGPEEVTRYNMAYRLFGIIPMVINVILTPYWPAISKAYSLDNFDWIKKKMNILILLWLLFSLAGVLAFFFVDKIYFLWLGKDLEITQSMNFGMLVYVMIASWNMIYAMFINSIGKIRLQLISSSFTGLLNIPLSIYFARQFGPYGVIWATSACLLVSAIWSPLQYHKLVSGTAKGIWNR
ncbi:MAG: lipopolysaccharide biosynthesis protein [Agriterribacter sp.]